jgi:hypothetical protein
MGMIKKFLKSSILGLGFAASLSPVANANESITASILGLKPPHFHHVDSNQDKKITRAEWINYRQKQFDAIDRNQDNFITKTDWSGFPLAVGLNAKMQKMIGDADLNHDQKVSRDEFKVAPIPQFDQADLDRNHWLSPLEFQTLLNKK